MYFEKHSLYTKNLIESGDLIQHDKDRYVLSLIDIKKVIESDLLTISEDAKLGQLVELVKKSKRNIFPVVSERDELRGIITLDDVRDVMFDDEARLNVRVKSLMQKAPTEVYPSDDMQTVMNKFEVTQAWNLPVIENGKYLGLV